MLSRVQLLKSFKYAWLQRHTIISPILNHTHLLYLLKSLVIIWYLRMSEREINVTPSLLCIWQVSQETTHILLLMICKSLQYSVIVSGDGVLIICRIWKMMWTRRELKVTRTLLSSLLITFTLLLLPTLPLLFHVHHKYKSEKERNEEKKRCEKNGLVEGTSLFLHTQN